MYTLIISAFAGFLVGLVIILSRNKNMAVGNIAVNLIIFTVCGFFVGAIAVLFFTRFLCNPVEQIVATEKLVSLRQNDHQASGNFYLGHGSIRNRTYFFYYVQTNKGGYQFKRLVNEKVVIYEDESCQPKLLFFAVKDISPYQGKWYFYESLSSWRYEFHVPPGSIQRNFVLQ